MSDEKVLALIQEQFKEFRYDMKQNLMEMKSCVNKLEETVQTNNEKQIRMAEVCVSREKDLLYQKKEIEKLKVEVRPIRAMTNAKNIIIGILSFIILLAGAISASKAIANNLFVPVIERSSR